MRNRPSLSWAAVVAGAALLCWHAPDSSAQEVSGYPWPVDFEPSDDEWNVSAFAAFPSDQSTVEHLIGRLEQTEARLSALQAAQSQASAEGASQTMIEGGLAKALRDRFDQIQDPAITTVNQQTRNTSGAKKNWFDRLSIRGYAQFRFNEVLWDDPDGAPPHHVGDGSIGDNQSFLIRRARLILSGDVSDHMYVYIQPDFAASVPGSPDANHFTQLRDCYCDVYFDEEKVHLLRIGQSKVPSCRVSFGWPC